MFRYDGFARKSFCHEGLHTTLPADVTGCDVDVSSRGWRVL
jgi:hypothetical protein